MSDHQLPGKINLREKLALIDKLWTPKIVGELNGQHLKLAKVKGEFSWHQHDNADELFLVIRGRLTIELRDSNVELSEGEIFVVPRGVEHRPVADQEAHILLFEPKGTLNTGDVNNELTAPADDWI
jgi:mannose-6-phosphate isomerase-like protein (cupin superfamily)